MNIEGIWYGRYYVEGFGKQIKPGVSEFELNLRLAMRFIHGYYDHNFSLPSALLCSGEPRLIPYQCVAYETAVAFFQKSGLPHRDL
jgi:hypothetical protein